MQHSCNASQMRDLERCPISKIPCLHRTVVGTLRCARDDGQTQMMMPHGSRH